MVAFLTLFLGLVVGVQPVQVTVGPDVATVELRLDGETVGTLEGEPWTLPVDLGPELSPHRLEAVAFDSQGRELGRVSQTLNLPRPPVELSLAVDTSSQPAVARMFWRSVLGGEPTDVRLVFDGEAIPVTDPAEVELPDHDPGRLHFLRAELTFDDGSRATDELVFGAASDQVAQELTAVPVRVVDDGELTVGDLQGILGSEGRELTPVAVDSGSADVLVVPDGGARDALRQIGAVLRRGASNLDPRSSRAFSSPLFRLGLLARDDVLRVLWPQPQRRENEEGALDFDVFPMTAEQTHDDGGIYWQVAEARHGWNDTGIVRLADAVAVAGSRAAARNRPRAVVVLVSGPVADASTLGTGQVERYLARLGVPLHVWSLAPRASKVEAGDGGFSEAEVVSKVRDLTRATKVLQEDLDRQRMVWVEGRLLPQEIEVQGSPEVERTVGLPEVPEVSGRDRVASFLADFGRRGAAPEPASAEPRDPRWRRARRLLDGVPETPQRLGSWRLLTDVDDPRLRERLGRVAAKAEEAYADRFGLLPKPPDEGAEAVILFAREEEYRTFEELGDTATGLGLEGHAGGGLAVLYRGKRPEPELTALLVHELAHLLHERVFGDRLPPWLEEGMAEDLALSRVGPEGEIELGSLGGGARVDRYGSLEGERLEITGGVALLGRLARRVSQGRMPDLAELLTMSREAFVQPADRGLRYAASAFFVRFLLDRYPEEFRAFLEAVAFVRPATVGTLVDHVGVGLDALERQFHAWIRTEAVRAGYR